MNNIEENICQAIEMIVQKNMDEAKFDKTIQAKVHSCVDATLGKYKINYQDSTFYAFSTNPEVTFSDGSLVYILIPNNDMSRDKTILGSVDKLGKNFTNIVEPENLYDKVGSNCVEVNTTNVLTTNETVYLYNIDTNTNLIGLDPSSVATYLKDSNSMICGASFKTDIPPQIQFKGNYGIVFILDFEDGAQRQYVIDIDNMEGNPYQFNFGKRQYKIFNIDGANFKQIHSIYVFSEKFTIDEKKPFKIEISNVELYGANKMTDAEINGCGISFYTPKGTLYSGTELPITAQVKVKGNIVNPEVQKLSFYWFVEDSSVGVANLSYNKYGGVGWRCLNPFNETLDENKNVFKEWLPTEDLFLINDTFLTQQKLTDIAAIQMKCVVIYDGIAYSKKLIIKNINATYKITLSSDLGTQFFHSSEKITLSCNVEPILTGLTYYWNEEDAYGKVTNIKKTTEPKLEILDFGKVDTFITYLCSVYNGEILLGTASIKLVNNYKTEETYTALIENGTQLFQYDESGLSPASPSNTIPLVLKPLGVKVFDKAGEPADGETILSRGGKITWKIPKDNTMIEVNSKNINGDFIVIENTPILDFKIRNQFQYSAQKNNVEVVIEYKNFTFTEKTNFSFIKQGDPGTNGTQYACRIVPNTSDTLSVYPMLIVEDGIAKFNFTPNNGSQFKVELYDNGELVFNDFQGNENVTLEWDILRNKNSDGTNLTIDKINGKIEYSGTEIKINQYNIIKCTVTYNKVKLYTTFPIIVSTSSKLALKADTGFTYVTYESDGARPKYNNSLPFEIQDNLEVATTISWTIYGEPELSLKGEKETNKNTFKVRPENRYNGYSKNNGVCCNLSSGGFLVASILIPVHLLLNKYGLSSLNDWDGNSININKEEGYILAPQMGAGKKDSDNTFTGVIMGEAYYKSGSSDVGLMGFNKGERTFFLDSETGKLELGKVGAGQIILDPTGNEAIIKSGNYSLTNKTGMAINLTTPEIIYGNGNFKVDANGHLTATGANISGTITATAGDIGGCKIQNGVLKVQTANISGTITANKISGGELSGVSLNINNNFIVNSSGYLTATGANLSGVINATGGHVGNWYLDSLGNLYTSEIKLSDNEITFYNSRNTPVAAIEQTHTSYGYGLRLEWKSGGGYVGIAGDSESLQYIFNSAQFECKNPAIFNSSVSCTNGITSNSYVINSYSQGRYVGHTSTTSGGSLRTFQLKDTTGTLCSIHFCGGLVVV